ncbi:MAG: hypothetical protein SFV81_06170 [Pirellulaceae bacterium]|nr:hypothetical protein [Pirellulaceae bacterium]
MTLDAALWAGSTALTGKSALAFWTTALLLQRFDRRKTAIAWQILLTFGAVAGCVLGGIYAAGPVTQWAWIGSAIVAGLCAARDIRQWTRTSPRETYEEVSQIDGASKKSDGTRKSTRSQPMKASPAMPLPWFDLLGIVAVVAAISISIYASVSPRAYAWYSVVHTIAACVLWGVAIFSAIELTFGSAPLSLSAVSWSGAAFIALGCWLAESWIAAVIVLSPADESADMQSLVMTRLFAISILLMDFVVWIIPHRVAKFKRTGKASEWVSLSMAAWIGMLSLTLLCALPSNWPWRHL